MPMHLGQISEVFCGGCNSQKRQGDQGQTGSRWLRAGGYPFSLRGCALMNPRVSGPLLQQKFLYRLPNPIGVVPSNAAREAV